MKRLVLAIAFCASASTTLMGQGTISFQNFATGVGGRVYVGTGWTNIGLGQAGSYHVELLAGLPGSTSINDLTSRRVFFPTTDDGQFFDGSTVTLASIPAGLGSADPAQNVVLALRGWTGNYPDYASAYVASWSGLSIIGFTALFTNPTGGGGIPPSTPANLTGWLNINNLILAPIPEPGTIGLLVMGGASLLFFCRRRRGDVLQGGHPRSPY